MARAAQEHAFVGSKKKKKEVAPISKQLTKPNIQQGEKAAF